MIKYQVPQNVTLAILAKGHNPPTDWARELFKLSEDAEIPLISIKKIGKFWIFLSMAS